MRQNGTTGTVTPLEKFTETASLLISHSMSTLIDKRIAVSVTNRTASPYLMKKHTQIAKFLVTPERSNHIKQAVMAILNMIPQCDSDLTAHLNDFLRTKKPEQQNNTFWFPTPENPGKTEDHTPIQTRILNELKELKDKGKLNPQESTESRNIFLKRFDWIDTLLTETAKQAIEDILVDYHDIFARHRMDIGMNTEFKVKLTPKDDKSCLQPKSTNADPLERRPICRIGSNAQVWNHYSTAFLQVRKPYICTKKAQRKSTSRFGSPQNQQSDCG